MENLLKTNRKSHIYKYLYSYIKSMNTNNICYTGIGSVKTGNYTKSQYLKVINKTFKKE